MRRSIFYATLVACLVSHPTHLLAQETMADSIVRGGTIYTLQADRPSPVQAIAISEGRVIAAGSDEHIERLRHDGTQMIDLKGAYATPGLVDAHAHVFNLGRFLQRVNLKGTTSWQECIERAREMEKSLPPGAWLRGYGWDQNDWDPGEYPRRQMLDEAFGDRPVYFERVDGHAGWASSAALLQTGFDANTPDPEGGELLREADGSLRGVLIDAADEMLTDQIPNPSPDQLDELLALASRAILAAGLAGVHDMGLTMGEMEAIERAELNGTLGIRIVGYVAAETFAEFPGHPRRNGSASKYRLEGVKFYADGALGSRGAALLQDYSDRPGHRGLLRSSTDVLRDQVTHAMTRGLSVAIHAIGDRGNRVALDAIEYGYAQALMQTSLPPLAGLRARVEHVQVVHPNDLPRFRNLGVIPSMQPTHCTSDMPWAPERVGPDRIHGAYAWRQLLDDGNLLPLGSDFPVENVSPLEGLYAARTRQAPDGSPADGWAPQERLTALEALLGFSAWPARVLGEPAWGTLSAGARADITVLDVDPLGPNAADLLHAQVLMTVVEGLVGYRSTGF